MILRAVPGRPEIKARSPPNPEVLVGLLRCFDESYTVAYGAARWRRAPRHL
ncbi:hypothetical protein VDQ94_08050 [Xanthomonas campestris pv. campestris]|nr:hypothetical protein [Xanthomonas campestris pv. campestris]MEB1553610.1 hypothetical protein [Xanthomonas campestris pv. campestris]